jgi:hypothetical protein
MQRIFNKLERYFGSWIVGIMNPDKGLWSVAPSCNQIGYLKAMNARGYHIFMKPEDERRFLLLDDIPENRLKRQKEHDRFKPGRLVVETSPGNFQIWIKAGRNMSNPEKRYWIRYFNADSACDPNFRWGRCPGFRNRKDKYEHDGQYPLSRLIWVDWKYIAKLPKVDIAKEEKAPPKVLVRIKRENRKMTTPIKRSDYDRGGESETDFSYALALLRRGFDIDEIKDRLLSERGDWTHHKGEKRQAAYLERTVKRALEIINA